MFPEFVIYVDKKWLWNMFIVHCMDFCSTEIMTTVAIFWECHADLKYKDCLCWRRAAYPLQTKTHKLVPHCMMCIWLLTWQFVAGWTWVSSALVARRASPVLGTREGIVPLCSVLGWPHQPSFEKCLDNGLRSLGVVLLRARSWTQWSLWIPSVYSITVWSPREKNYLKTDKKCQSFRIIPLYQINRTINYQIENSAIPTASDVQSLNSNLFFFSIRTIKIIAEYYN